MKHDISNKTQRNIRTSEHLNNEVRIYTSLFLIRLFNCSLFIIFLLPSGTGLLAQSVGINATGVAPDASAMLDINSASKGFAMPRMTTVQRYAIANPMDGLQVYDTDLKGYYFFNGTNWNCVTTPAGTIDYFANNSSPIGYLECNGQAVSRIQYPELFTAIDTLYGSGDGSSTFNLPDLRGEFLRGIDNGRGVDAGRTIGSFQKGTFHGVGGNPNADLVTDFSTSTAFGAMQDDFGLDNTTLVNYPNARMSSGGGAPSVTPVTIDGAYGINRPRNIALLPCIKY